MKDFHIQWHINKTCNLRCLHCYQDNFTGETELSLDNLIKIAQNIFETMKRWRSYLYLSLTGGEPLIKKELWDLIEYLKKSQRLLSLSIITNGTLIDRYIDKILHSNIKKIFISLDGTSQNTNDYIRGEEVFKKVLENIALLKSKKIKVFLMYTLMNSNFEDAINLISFCKKNNIDGFILEKFFPLGRGKLFLEQMVSKEKLLFIYKEIFRQAGYEFILEDNLSCRAIYVNLQRQPKIYISRCVVSNFGLAILEDGSVLPCRRFTLKIGNLLEDKLYKIWKTSEVLEKIRNRKNLKGLCKTCIVKDCFGCRAMAYTLKEDYLAQDPFCFLDN